MLIILLSLATLFYLGVIPFTSTFFSSSPNLTCTQLRAGCSMYVRDGIDLWLIKWKNNGWMTSQRKEVKNIDLWMQLDALACQRQIKWHWVRGHAGHPDNERADLLARNAIVQQIMQHEILD